VSSYGDPYRAAPPPLSKQDDDALNTLSVFFYLYAGFIGLIALVMLAMAILPAILISAAPYKPGDPPPALIGGILAVVFGAVALLLIAKAVLMIFAGRAMGRRSSYMLCTIAACAACLQIPIGTALGIFTLITLQKPAVKARFGYS
jgi:hypothetical protein